VPETALLPLQEPFAVQLVAFVELHVRVDVAPLKTVIGEAASVTVGTPEEDETVTVTEALLLPP
jgi:hypothetical protein